MAIKLLHVEDSDVILELVDIALQLSGGFEVLSCLSGRDALSKAEEFKPDVFLLDYVMPGMSGLETLRRLHELPGLEGVPAFFFTARCEEDFVTRAIASGAKGVFFKPYDPLKLAEKIKFALAK